MSSYSREELDSIMEKVSKSSGVVTPQNYFVQVPNSFVRNTKLNTNEKMMYIYLWGFGGETRNMYPSQGRMVKELGWQKQKIGNVLTSLERKGGVYIINRFNEATNEKLTNLYYLAEINNNTGEFYAKSIELIVHLYPEKKIYMKK